MTATVDAVTDVATRVDSVTSNGGSDRTLGRGSVRFVMAIAMSIGIQGPTAGVIIGPAIIASIVGGPGALAQVLALVTMGFVAYAFVRFSRSFNSAGSVYAFNGTALGSGYGFVSAWILLLVYTSFAAGVFAATADIAQTFFASLGLHAWWVWFAVAAAALALLFAFLRIGLSSLIVLACEGISIVLISAVGVAVLIKGGYHQHALNTAPFQMGGASVSLLALGVVAAFGQFSGFEGAATLGDEARRSTRTIPAAMVWSLVISSGVYIFFTWLVYNAYPSTEAVAADPAPLVHVASTYLSPAVGIAVNAAGILSAFGASLACLNAASRLLFALGRETAGRGRTGKLLGHTSRYRSPSGALLVVGSVAVAALLGFALEPTATRTAALIIQYGAYLIVLVYLMTVIAAFAWTWRTDRRPVPLTILAIGVGLLGYILDKTFLPLPPAPFNLVLIAASGSVILGVAMLGIPAVRARLTLSALLAATSSDATAGSPVLT